MAIPRLVSRPISTCSALVALSLSIAPALSIANPSSNPFRRHTSLDSMSSISVAQFPCLSDNYGFLIHDHSSGETAAVDTPCASSYENQLRKRGWKLTHIFNTHHHHDHTGGNLALKKLYTGVKIIGPLREERKIPGIDTSVTGGDCFEFGQSKVEIMDVGGHTLGHIAYYFPEHQKVFCGDALFALGCGRMFEGTPDQFWESLTSLRELPDDTVVYCAHEYTESNAKFALSVEPGNLELLNRVQIVQEQRSRGEATVPTDIGLEKRTNPFFRVDTSAEIRSRVGILPEDTDADAFAKVRRAKDMFRG